MATKKLFWVWRCYGLLWTLHCPKDCYCDVTMIWPLLFRRIRADVRETPDNALTTRMHGDYRLSIDRFFVGFNAICCTFLRNNLIYIEGCNCRLSTVPGLFNKCSVLRPLDTSSSRWLDSLETLYEYACVAVFCNISVWPVTLTMPPSAGSWSLTSRLAPGSVAGRIVDKTPLSTANIARLRLVTVCSKWLIVSATWVTCSVLVLAVWLLPLLDAGVPGVSFEKTFLCSRPSLCLSTWRVVCLALMYIHVVQCCMVRKLDPWLLTPFTDCVVTIVLWSAGFMGSSRRMTHQWMICMPS